jgi:hypothetical protein
MADGKENCDTCGPGDLKVERVNGRNRVMVPDNFMAHVLGSPDQQLAEAMDVARMLESQGIRIGEGDDLSRIQPGPTDDQPYIRLPQPEDPDIPRDFETPGYTDEPPIVLPPPPPRDPTPPIGTPSYYPSPLTTPELRHPIHPRNFTIAETDAADVAAIPPLLDFTIENESCKCALNCYTPGFLSADGEPTRLPGYRGRDGTWDHPLYSVAIGSYLLLELAVAGGEEDGRYEIHVGGNPLARPPVQIAPYDAASGPPEWSSGEWTRRIAGKLDCPGTVKVWIRANWDDYDVPITGLWNGQQCGAIFVKVCDPTPTAEQVPSELTQTQRSHDEARGVQEDKDPPPEDAMCRFTRCRLVESFWGNHPWRGSSDNDDDSPRDRELTEEFNEFKGAGRRSWHASWPGYPEWHVTVDVEVAQMAFGWLHWHCEVDVYGDKPDDSASIGVLIRDEDAFRRAWLHWFAALLELPVDSDEVRNAVANLEARRGQRPTQPDASRPNNRTEFPGSSLFHVDLVGSSCLVN